MVNWPFADLVNKNAQDIVHNQHYSYMTMIQDKVEPFIKKKTILQKIWNLFIFVDQ